MSVHFVHKQHEKHHKRLFDNEEQDLAHIQKRLRPDINIDNIEEQSHIGPYILNTLARGNLDIIGSSTISRALLAYLVYAKFEQRIPASPLLITLKDPIECTIQFFYSNHTKKNKFTMAGARFLRAAEAAMYSLCYYLTNCLHNCIFNISTIHCSTIKCTTYYPHELDLKKLASEQKYGKDDSKFPAFILKWERTELYKDCEDKPPHMDDKKICIDFFHSGCANFSGLRDPVEIFLATDKANKLIKNCKTTKLSKHIAKEQILLTDSTKKRSRQRQPAGQVCVSTSFLYLRPFIVKSMNNEL